MLVPCLDLHPHWVRPTSPSQAFCALDRRPDPCSTRTPSPPYTFPSSSSSSSFFDFDFFAYGISAHWSRARPRFFGVYPN
ncbi:hypothetical protein PGTUg99_013594 [Puccinia graminis f. sp. tritici]|uniref:Uncharacterized protein n=1 Tax=Puccinia graminis f. sp. tritici TaxID=56615 RepID=A0A5B0M373_PUCGR|nr:hypothetical protein PGTUg99_013594 [Puccinia graminis f. sp. tritici]